MSKANSWKTIHQEIHILFKKPLHEVNLQSRFVVRVVKLFIEQICEAISKEIHESICKAISKTNLSSNS